MQCLFFCAQVGNLGNFFSDLANHAESKTFHTWVVGETLILGKYFEFSVLSCRCQLGRLFFETPVCISHSVFIILDEYCTHYAVEKAKSRGGGWFSFGELEESYYVVQADLKGSPASDSGVLGLQTAGPD